MHSSFNLTDILLSRPSKNTPGPVLYDDFEPGGKCVLGAEVCLIIILSSRLLIKSLYYTLDLKVLYLIRLCVCSEALQGGVSPLVQLRKLT